MMIDADARLIPGRYEAEALLRDMDLSGVDRALVSLEMPFEQEMTRQLECLYQMTWADPKRLIGLPLVDPRHQEQAGMIPSWRQQYGFPAVLVDSARCGVRLDDWSLMAPLAEVALEQQMPLCLRVSGATLDLTHPSRLARLVARWPNLRVVAIHMGGANRPDYSLDVIEVAKAHSNLWLAGSGIRWQRLPSALEAVGASRVMFGSGVPVYGLLPASVAAYQVLLEQSGIPAGERQAVLGDNALRLFQGLNEEGE